MSGSTRSSADLDPRRRKILFRAWHRGMREMDLIMGRFADDAIAGFSDAELDEFERLIEVLDRDLLSWVTGEAAVPEQLRHGAVPAARGFHHHLTSRFMCRGWSSPVIVIRGFAWPKQPWNHDRASRPYPGHKVCSWSWVQARAAALE